MEERRERLDLAAAGSELELAAAVEHDPLLLAVVVEVEQPLQRAEPRRLRVEATRREGQRLDVFDGVDREIPGDAIAVRREHRIGLRRQPGILDPGVGKALGGEPVEVRPGCGVDPVPLVEALQIDGIDGAGRCESVDELGRPFVARVELEAQRGIELEVGERVLLRRDDEGDGPRLSSERLCDGEPGLAEREVEGGALDTPAPVAGQRGQ